MPSICTYSPVDKRPFVCTAPPCTIPPVYMFLSAMLRSHMGSFIIQPPCHFWLYQLPSPKVLNQPPVAVRTHAAVCLNIANRVHVAAGVDIADRRQISGRRRIPRMLEVHAAVRAQR